MSIRTSPVFYFGLLLTAVVVGLLAAPFVIDWNGYRAEMESQARRLTGRDVRINGDIAARLFPWPKLTIDDVAVANPPGFEHAEFASADRIVTRIALAGLFQGSIDVESIEVEHPVLRFERPVSGTGNWALASDISTASNDILKRIKLDQIRMSGGDVYVVDRRRGERHHFTGVNASISAPQLAGPWRVRTLANYADRVLDIGINTGIMKPGEPARFAVRVANADQTGFVFSFDGTSAEGKADGDIRIEPAAPDDGKVTPPGEPKPLVLKAKVTATFDEIAMRDIEVAPRQITEGGTLIGGTALLRLGKHITAETALSASTFNADEFLGSEARQQIRTEGVLPYAAAVLGMMPANLSVKASLNVTALTVGGETLDAAAAMIDADRDAIRINRLTATLPGRTQVLYEGIFFPGQGGAEAAGSLALETGDLRRLSEWAWPDSKPRIGQLWTGSRGHFKMQTDVGLTPSRLRFTKTEFELDGERGTAEFSRSSGGRDAIDLRVKIGRLDLDSYVQGGLQAFSAAAAQGAGAAIAALLPEDNASDVLLNLEADEMVLNRVTAAGVRLDLASGVSGLDLRHLKISSVGGAALDATGLILDTSAGPDGSIGLDVKAADPRGMLRLLGLVSGDIDPAWVAELGDTALKATVAVRPRSGKSETVVDLTATSGQLSLAANGAVVPLGTGHGLNGSGELTTASGAQMARLLGLQPHAEDKRPARLVATVAGRAAGGFDADLQLEAFNGQYGYRGTIDPLAVALALEGTMSVRSTATQALAEALGLPLEAPPNLVLVLDSPVKTEAGTIKLVNLVGRLGEAEITGEAALDRNRRLTASLATGGVSARDVLAVVFLEPGSGPAGLESTFAPHLPFGLTGEIWVTPKSLQVHDQFIARDVQIGVTARPDEIAVAIYGKDAYGEDTLIEIKSAGTTEVRKLSGKVVIPVDLAKQVQLIGGLPVASGQGSLELGYIAEGRSPGGALSSLRGNGTYQFDDLRLLGLSPELFLSTIDRADEGAAITAAFDSLRTGELTASGKAMGFVTVVDGEVAFQPLTFKTAQSKVDLRVVGELALGQIDANLSIGFAPLRTLPGMTISYAGPPFALARSEDNTELATKLGVDIMQKGIDELERLRREQDMLAKQEELQRVEDEERLAAYYAQRDELLLRRRELKVHGEMQLLEAERLRARLEEERAANAEINKLEVKQRVREIRILRRLARAERADSAQPIPAPSAKPKARNIVAPKPKAAKTTEPVILVQPETAPVIISPEPSFSPSQ